MAPSNHRLKVDQVHLVIQNTGVDQTLCLASAIFQSQKEKVYLVCN